MPVQINEVIVKTVVSNNSGGGNNPVPVGSGSASVSIASQNELAAIVLEIIKEKKER